MRPLTTSRVLELMNDRIVDASVTGEDSDLGFIEGDALVLLSASRVAGDDSEITLTLQAKNAGEEFAAVPGIAATSVDGVLNQRLSCPAHLVSGKALVLAVDATGDVHEFDVASFVIANAKYGIAAAGVGVVGEPGSSPGSNPVDARVFAITMPSAVLSKAYSFGPLESAGLGDNVGWSIGEGGDALPDGITLDEETGVFSGTPTSGGGGTFHLEVTATGDDGDATATIDLTVMQFDTNPYPMFTGSIAFDAGDSTGDGVDLVDSGVVGQLLFLRSDLVIVPGTTVATKLQHSNDDGDEDPYADVASGSIGGASDFPADPHALNVNRSDLKQWIRIAAHPTGVAGSRAVNIQMIGSSLN